MSVSAQVHMRRDTHLTLYTSEYILDDPPAFLQLCMYLMDGLFLSQQTNNNIRISYSLKQKHLKKEYILCKKIKSKIQQCNVSYALYGGYFCKEKLLLSSQNSSILYCRSASAYFPYFRAIPVQRYCTWSQSRYLTLMALLQYTLSLI